MKVKNLIIFMLCVFLLPLQVCAQNGNCGDNISWNFANGTLTISGTGEMTSSNFYPVADITEKIILEEGITSISRSAFSNFKLLYDVSLPSTLTTISADAFWSCPALTQIYIPENVSEIGLGALGQCLSLTEIEVSANNSHYSSLNGVLFNNAQTKLICYPSGKKSVSYTIPSSVTKIDTFAFTECPYLDYISAGSHITNVESSAFYSCDSIVLCEEDSAVFKYAENYCWGNYDYLFYKVDNQPVLLNYGTCGNELTYSFYSDGTLEINGTGHFITEFEDTLSRPYIHTRILKLGATVKGINSDDGSAFRFDNSMKEIIVDKNNPYLYTEDGVLFNHDMSVLIKYPTGNIRNKYIVPSGVKRIRERAFERSVHLKELVLPEGLLRIDYGAAYFSSIQTVTLPSSITHIGAWSMIYSANDTNLDALTSLSYLGNNAFSATDFYSNWLDKQPDGVVYLGNVLLCYKGDMPENTTIFVKEGTTQIYENAFSGYTNLVDVKIPDSVYSIGNDAFYGTAWFDTQPEGLVYAGKVAYCFKGQTKESKIVIKDGTKGIGGNAFIENYDLPEPFFTTITEISLPDSLICIESGAFSGCPELKSIRLPKATLLIDRYWQTFQNVQEIVGYSDTFAEQFAHENGLDFKKILSWNITKQQISDTKFTYELNFTQGYENDTAIVITNFLSKLIHVNINIQTTSPKSGSAILSVDIPRNNYDSHETLIWENLSNIKPIKNQN